MTHQLIKPYIFYHSHCQDGILATAVMLNHFKKQTNIIDPQVIAYNHGDPIDVKQLKISRSFTKNRDRVFIEVYFLDILPSTDIVRGVANTGCKIYIMDHHKSAIPTIKEIVETKKDIVVHSINQETGEYENNSSIVKIPRYTNIENHFAMGLSGCGIAWKYCTARTTAGTTGTIGTALRTTAAGTTACVFPNPLVEFVQDRDLWNHYYEESNWILSYLTTYCKASSPEIYMDELCRWEKDTGHYTLISPSTTSSPSAPFLFVNDHGMECIKEGKRLFEDYQKECDRIAKNHTVKKLELPTGVYNVAVAECVGKYASAVGNILAEAPGIDFAVSYEIVTKKNGGNTNCRGIKMTLDNPENPFIYLRARGSSKNNLDLSSIIRLWDAEGSTGGGHMKAAGSTSTMNKFITSFC